MKTIKKVIGIGGSIGVTIKSDEIEGKKIEKGDFLEMEVTKLIKKEGENEGKNT